MKRRLAIILVFLVGVMAQAPLGHAACLGDMGSIGMAHDDAGGDRHGSHAIDCGVRHCASAAAIIASPQPYWRGVSPSYGEAVPVVLLARLPTADPPPPRA